VLVVSQGAGGAHHMSDGCHLNDGSNVALVERMQVTKQRYSVWLGESEKASARS
jgi:hypothetical protein